MYTGDVSASMFWVYGMILNTRSLDTAGTEQFSK